MIVCVACKDECVTNLSHIGKEWFKKLGSTVISNLRFRCGFAFISSSGEANEKIALRQKDQVEVS